MFEKIVKFLKSLCTKNVLRICLALTATASVVLGIVTMDGASAVYGDTVLTADTAFAGAEEKNENADTDTVTDIGETEEDDVTVAVGDGADETEDKTQEETLPELLKIGDIGNELAPLDITTSYVTVKETVKYGYKKVYSDKLYRGESETTSGKNGEKEVVYTVVKVNGLEVYRDSYSEKVTKEPVAQVETIGTRLHASTAVMTSEDVKSISTLKPENPIELDKNGIPVNYTKVISGKSSAYCGKCDNNMTAIGLPAQPGLVAVNFKQIPKYTKMYIVANDGTVYGYAIAADTGGFASNGSKRIVDVRMPTGSKCNCGSQWGVKNVKIYILE